MLKRFGQVFGESWREWKTNWKLYFKLFFILGVIPMLVIGAVLYLLAILKVDNLIISIISLVLFIIFFVFSILIFLSIIYSSFFSQNKLSFKQAVKGGKSYFWKSLGLIIILSVFLLLMAIPTLGILALVFGIYWIFSLLVLVRENTGIMESLKRSKLIIKGHWWRTFGFLLLFAIIILLISLAFLIPIGIIFVFAVAGFIIGFIIDILASVAVTGVSTGITTGVPIGFGLAGLVVGLIIITILQFFYTILLYPLQILFLKNLYLDMRKEKA